MIDLHCHILPGVDDGALDVADSLAMARQAERDGIASVCATPHIRHDHDVRIGELRSRVAALNAALETAGVDVRVLPGGEVAEPSVGRLSDDELRAVTLGGGGRWILLEPRAGPLSERLPDTVRALARRGLRTVVAHPERHLGPEAIEHLRAAVEAGALVQVTAAFLEDGPTVAGILALVEQRLVHIVASDAHSSHGGRPVRLSGALRQLAAAGLSERELAWMADGLPRTIVRGD